MIASFYFLSYAPRMNKETDDHTVTWRKTLSHWIITSHDKNVHVSNHLFGHSCCQIPRNNLVNGIISEKKNLFDK
jgi:hypothetical protein